MDTLENTLRELLYDTMDLFDGLMYGQVDYSFDQLHCVMKTDICEIFSLSVEEVILNINSGREVTKEQLEKMRKNLNAFAREFKVKEARALAKNVKKIIEEHYSIENE